MTSPGKDEVLERKPVAKRQTQPIVGSSALSRHTLTSSALHGLSKPEVV
mgnify:CR=1 FL=1